MAGINQLRRRPGESGRTSYPGGFFPYPGEIFPGRTHRARTAETPGHAVKQCTAMPAGGAGDGNALYGLFMAVGK